MDADRRPRIAPGGLADVGVVNWLTAWVSGRVAGTPPPNVFLTLGRARGLYRGWLHFAGKMMPGGKLPRDETELMIVRVAHLADCAYELEHHRRLGRRAGLTDADLDAAVAGPDDPHWSDRRRTLLRAVDELHHDRNLGDGTWTALRRHLSEPETIELLLLAGHYEMLATTINTLRVPPDPHR